MNDRQDCCGNWERPSERWQERVCDAVMGNDRPAPQVKQAQLAQLPRQYMHNKENAVTMRLSAHYRQLNNPYNYT